MKKLFWIFLLFGLLWGRGVLADQPVVIELFTSQGCDMCPPAHVLQKEYSEMSEVIALTWHVEHWDFMGWRDTFAKPEFSKRQYIYNQRFGRKGVYTPQAVVNGNEQVVASKKLELYTSIRNAMASNQTKVSVSFTGTPGGATVNVGRGSTETPTDVLLLWVKSSDSVRVNSGNNIGKTFASMNIVRHFDIIGALKNQNQSFSINMSDPNKGDADLLAILVQEENGGRIVGAGMIRISDLNN